MEESAKKKGTVTSLASVFPVDQAHKAAKGVEDAIADKHNVLDHVRGFIADNNNLINLVHKLPEQLSHDVMVTVKPYFLLTRRVFSICDTELVKFYYVWSWLCNNFLLFWSFNFYIKMFQTRLCS